MVESLVELTVFTSTGTSMHKMGVTFRQVFMTDTSEDKKLYFGSWFHTLPFIEN